MCVILRYYDEMSLQEIADTLEVSLGTVKSRLSRASKKMRDEIERLRRKRTRSSDVSFRSSGSELVLRVWRMKLTCLRHLK